jgi:hypothetical protein
MKYLDILNYPLDDDDVNAVYINENFKLGTWKTNNCNILNYFMLETFLTDEVDDNDGMINYKI